MPPYQPADLRWLAAGVPDKPAGIVVPLNDGLRRAVADALNASPVPMPDPTPSPASPPVVRHVANPDVPGRGIGLGLNNLPAGRTVADVHYEGFSTNVSVEHCPSLSVRNLRSVRAWRLPITAQDARLFQGQGLYVDEVRGGVAVRDSLFGWNGWQPGRPVADRSQYRHGAYNNFGAIDPVYEDCIFVGNPACGAQCRGGGTFRRCVFLDNSIGLLASMGLVVMEDCLVYGAGYYHVVDSRTGRGAWTGHAGAAVYSTLRMSGTAIVGRPGQAAGDDVVKAHVRATGAKCYPGPALQLNRQAGDPAHPQWRPPAGGPSVVASDCVVSGWPVAPFGGSGWPKDARGDFVPAAGVRLLASAPQYDYGGTLDGVLSERGLSVREAAAAIQRDVRRLAGVA